MPNFCIVESSSTKWDEIVKKSGFYDFHHTSYFHQIDSAYESLLLHFSDEENFIALPIKYREIPGTDYFDISSVYGYAGPVFSFEPNYNKQKLISFFNLTFKEFCISHKVVSVFSRLHPLISQKQILTSLGNIDDLNRTVSIDLNIPAEQQWSAYRKSLKYELAQIRKKDIRVQITKDKSDIDDFITIYYETMNRVGAASNYYFPKEYFHNFLNNQAFDSILIMAKFNDVSIAGAIFTITGKIMQYHLAGTKEEFIKETPMKLILDEARLYGNSTSAESLHLGGGVSGRDDDSLFKFKSGFSKNFNRFSIWKFIINQEVYNQLSSDCVNTGFFPLYRSSKL